MKEISLALLILPLLCSSTVFRPPPTGPAVRITTEYPTEITPPAKVSGRLSSLESVELEETCGKFYTELPEVVSKSFGSDSAPRSEAPWVVGLARVRGKENGTEILQGMCSATLISERHVLTAKHCGKAKLQDFRFVFDNDCAAHRYMGGSRFPGYAPNCSIDGAIIRKAIQVTFPKSPRSGSQDLMIFELDEPVPMSSDLYPACLAESIPNKDDVLQLFSFGDDGLLFPGPGKIGSLQKINVTVIPCQESEARKKGPDTFCVYSKHQMQRKGDSGGGFMSNRDNQKTVVGVVSGRWSISQNYEIGAEIAVAPHLSWICKYVGVCPLDGRAVKQLNPDIEVIQL